MCLWQSLFDLVVFEQKLHCASFFFFSRPRKLFSRPGLRSVVTSILRKNAGLTTRNNPKVKQFMFAQPNQKENVIWQLLKKKHLEKLSVTLIMKRLVEYLYINTCYWGSAVWQSELRHHLFSSTVIKGCGTWFKPGHCLNSLSNIIQRILTALLTNLPWRGH